MPTTSIYLPEDLRGEIEEQLDEDQSRSEWIKGAIRRELNKEHDDLEALEQRINDLERWKDETMQTVIEWFNSEFSPAK